MKQILLPGALQNAFQGEVVPRLRYRTSQGRTMCEETEEDVGVVDTQFG